MSSASRPWRDSLKTVLWGFSGLLLGLALLGAFGCLLAVAAGVMLTTALFLKQALTGHQGPSLRL